MIKNIAIQPDFKKRPNGTQQSFSRIWMQKCQELDIAVTEVDVFSDNFIEKIQKCDALMWRFDPNARELNRARDIFPALAQLLTIHTFPGPRVTHFVQDKIRQHTLLRLAQLPTPRTWVFYDESSARTFAEKTTFPMVIKLSTGSGSNNVGLLRNKAEMNAIIRQMFSTGIDHLWKARGAPYKRAARRLKYGLLRAIGADSSPNHSEHGKLLIQEFLPDNAFDTRVTIVGNYAYAFIRHNRTDDFRASGGGKIDYDQEKVDIRCIQMAFQVAAILKCPFIAIDFLERNNQPVVVELNFSYATFAVERCPGRWVQHTDNEKDLSWIQGSTSPEELTLLEFLRINP